MAKHILPQELADDLLRCIAQSNLGCLFMGDNAPDRAILSELLRNQFCIMRVLAAMNGLSHNPKAGNNLLEDHVEGAYLRNAERRVSDFAERAAAEGLKWNTASECYVDTDGRQYDREGIVL